MKTSNTILVTGGAGFIGSHTCKALSLAGFLPVAFDNLSTGHAEAVKWGPLVQADVRDKAAVAAAISQYQPQTIVHFAANAYVAESISDPEKYYQNNVVGMLCLLEACRENGLNSMVFSSSCSVYGIANEMPVTELSARIPISAYGRSKLMGEQILEDYALAYGYRHSILRYFNACGADPDGEIGEDHDPETHVIPLALFAAAGKLKQFEIYGADYQTPDGTCLRDFIHVSDLARAHVLAVKHLNADGENISVNLGSGMAYSIKQILESVREITGKSAIVIEKPARPGDPPALCADVSRAKEILGFETKHSDMTEIIQTAAAYFGMEIQR